MSGPGVRTPVRGAPERLWTPGCPLPFTGWAGGTWRPRVLRAWGWRWPNTQTRDHHGPREMGQGERRAQTHDATTASAKTRGAGPELPTPVFLGFPGGSAGKESACNVEDLASVPGLGRSPGERQDYPLQNSGLKNSRDCTVRGVAKSWTRLFFTFTCSFLHGH